jgi:hypothetical protein
VDNFSFFSPNKQSQACEGGRMRAECGSRRRLGGGGWGIGEKKGLGVKKKDSGRR